MKIGSILLLIVQYPVFSWSYQSCFNHNAIRHRQQSKLFLTPSSSLNAPFLIRKNDFNRNQPFLAPSLPVSKLFSTITDGNEQEASSSKSNENNLDEEGIGAWIPIASISSMKGLGPQRVTLMNVDFVIWHTEEEEKGSETKWTVQTDACTHRLAPLSQGRVDPETNCIECPYHGWQFDSNGNVTSIPQLDKGRTIQDVQRTSKSGRSGGVNLRTYPTHIVDDLLFVFLPSSLHGEMFPQSTLPEEFYPLLNDERIQGTEFFVRDLPYSFDFLVENFMDPAHIPFAHHSLQSTRDDGSPIMMEEMDQSRQKKRDAYACFQRPSFYHYSERKGELNEETGERSGPWELSLPILVVPVKAGKSRVFLSSPKLKLPKWLLHAGSNRFLNSDSWLHDTEREVVRRKESLPAEDVSSKLCGMDYQYQSKSDLGVSAFRKWWRDNGMADAPPHTFGMATMDQLGPITLSRREQIDPWENHSKHCSSCRQALQNMKKLQTASLFVALGSVLFGSSQPIFGILGAAIGVLGNRFFKKFATAIEGNPEASGVADRSAAAEAS